MIAAYMSNVRKMLCVLILLSPLLLLGWWFTASWTLCAQEVCGEGGQGPEWAKVGVTACVLAALCVVLGALSWLTCKVVPLLLTYARKPWSRVTHDDDDDDEPSTF